MLHVLHGHKKLGNFPSGFTNKKYCVPMNNVDVSNDKFVIKLADNGSLSNVSRVYVIIIESMKSCSFYNNAVN